MRHAFSIKLNVNKNDKNIDQGLILDRCEKGGDLMGVSGGGTYACGLTACFLVILFLMFVYFVWVFCFRFLVCVFYLFSGIFSSVV